MSTRILFEHVSLQADSSALTASQEILTLSMYAMVCAVPCRQNLSDTDRLVSDGTLPTARMAPERNASTGRLVADPERFPSGIAALADYAHARGLSLGVYSSAGNTTCQGRPASLGREALDAATFAEWQVDFVKLDNCGIDDKSPLYPPRQRYAAMGEALRQSGRKIAYSVCEWGVADPATWASSSEVGALMWRTTPDIRDAWESVISRADLNEPWYAYSSPGAYNDPDMLEVGNGGLTPAEERAHVALWALMKAPLILGADLAALSDAQLALLTNPVLLEIHSDALGAQGRRSNASGYGPDATYHEPMVGTLGWTSVPPIDGAFHWGKYSPADAAQLCLNAGAECEGFSFGIPSDNSTTSLRMVYFFRAADATPGAAPGDIEPFWKRWRSVIKRRPLTEVWHAPLEGGGVAALALNRDANATRAVHVDFHDVGALSPGGRFALTDVLGNAGGGVPSTAEGGGFTVEVAPHDAVVIRIEAAQWIRQPAILFGPRRAAGAAA